MYILFHVPSGMFEEQDSVGSDGVVRTGGITYTTRDKAESALRGLPWAGWVVLEKPANVITTYTE